MVKGSIALNQLFHRAIIQGNKLGTDHTGQSCIDVVNIGIVGCKDVIIGGHLQSEENIIHGNINTPQRHGVHVIKNTISLEIFISGQLNPAVDPFIKIISYDNSLITGLSNPNAKNSAVSEFAGIEKVWKLVDGVAQEQVIQTARRDPEAIEVVGGLAAGDVILTDASRGEIARVESTTASGPGNFHTLVAKPRLDEVATDDASQASDPADSSDTSSRAAE
jgi:hypothetical protein